MSGKHAALPHEQIIPLDDQHKQESIGLWFDRFIPRHRADGPADAAGEQEQAS